MFDQSKGTIFLMQAFQEFITYKFSTHDKNKFILLLEKCVYPYEYLDNWEEISKTSLPEKRFFTVT